MREGISALRNEIGTECVTTKPEALAELNWNAMGLPHTIVAAVFPSSVLQVRQVVEIATKFSLRLKPVSCGENIGYGRMQACLPDTVLVYLSRMKRITDYDPELGTVRVEPGVTQEELFEYLKQQGSLHFPDSTGARKRSSVLGNSIEGGFGHTPMGNRRALLSDVELVLPNGSLVRTGEFPNQGPDLSGLCVQFNLGIITSARIRLNREPERYESFLVICHEQKGFSGLFDTIARLRRDGTLTSLVHIANAMRFIMSAGQVPPTHANRLISGEDASQMMGGSWFAIGGLYGTSADVALRADRLRKAMRGIGKVLFFHDSLRNRRGPMGLGLVGIERLGRAILNDSVIAKVLALTPRLKAKLSKLGSLGLSYRPFHEMMKGIPSDMPYEKMTKWRVAKPEQMGLGWISPTGPATSDFVLKTLNTIKPVYDRFGFEFPITLTIVEPDRFVCVSNINFDLSNLNAVDNAHEFENAIHHALTIENISEYRNSILGMKTINYESSKHYLLETIKRAVDPQLIIDPGRYNIGWK